MAHITMPDGRELNEPDSDTRLLDYYRGEGATVELDPQTVAAQFPVVVQPGDVGPHPADEPPPFNPAEYTVQAVNEYLDTADPAEVARVLNAEHDGEARVGILDGPHRPQPGASDPEQPVA